MAVWTAGMCVFTMTSLKWKQRKRRDFLKKSFIQSFISKQTQLSWVTTDPYGENL